MNVEHIELDSGGRDVAIAVGLTHRNIEDVVAYVQDQRPEIGRVTHVFAAAGPGPSAVASHDHALRLALRLAGIVRERTLEQRRGTLHLFLAAPNVFNVFLGQQARTFGRIQLYEFPFGLPDQAGIYWPSISLPPEPGD